MAIGAGIGVVMRKRIAIRLLSVALALAVVALCTHAIGHWHASAYDELHCQACQVGHTANPQPVLHVAIPLLAPIARFAPAEECTPLLK